MKLNDIFDYRALRFAIVGVISNGILFLAYLALTEIGMASKFAMTLLYVTGVIQGFIFNKKWTFSHEGHVTKTFTAYVLLYAIGYLINLAILVVFVDRLGMPHQLVQGAATLTLAGFFFLTQRFLIFRTGNSAQSRI